MGEKIMDQKALEQKRLKLVMELGEEMHRTIRCKESFGGEKLKAISDEIRKVDGEIGKLAGDLNPKVCPQCGTALEEGIMFCGNCGCNVKDYYGKYTKTCPICGKKATEEQSYCGACGSKISD